MNHYDDGYDNDWEDDWEDTDPLGSHEGPRVPNEYENARFYVEELLVPQTIDRAVVLDGMHEAVIGIEESGRIVYSYDLMVEVMVEKMLMTYETAVGWIEEVLIPLRNEGAGFILVHKIGPGGR